jgi:hypothetical protein
MINRPRHLLLALFTGVLAFGLCPARADDAEAVKEKLFQAKKAYDAEVQKFKKAITELLDKRERDAFEKMGESPQMVPNAIRDPLTAARTKVDKAYTAAIKEYVRLKMDAAAGTTEKEQQEFNFSSAIQFRKRTFVSSLKPFDIRAFTDKTYAFEKDSDKYKMNGEIIPHSLFMHPDGKGEASVSYTLTGKMVAFRASIGIPKYLDPQQNPASPITFDILGDGKSLWKSEPVTTIDAFQTCLVNLDKVKTLTLRVSCKDFHWAHAVWFGPIVIE